MEPQEERNAKLLQLEQQVLSFCYLVLWQEDGDLGSLLRARSSSCGAWRTIGVRPLVIECAGLASSAEACC